MGRSHMKSWCAPRLRFRAAIKTSKEAAASQRSTWSNEAELRLMEFAELLCIMIQGLVRRVIVKCDTLPQNCMHFEQGAAGRWGAQLVQSENRRSRVRVALYIRGYRYKHECKKGNATRCSGAASSATEAGEAEWFRARANHSFKANPPSFARRGPWHSALSVSCFLWEGREPLQIDQHVLGVDWRGLRSEFFGGLCR